MQAAARLSPPPPPLADSRPSWSSYFSLSPFQLLTINITDGRQVHLHTMRKDIRQVRVFFSLSCRSCDSGFGPRADLRPVLSPFDENRPDYLRRHQRQRGFPSPRLPYQWEFKELTNVFLSRSVGSSSFLPSPLDNRRQLETLPLQFVRQVVC